MKSFTIQLIINNLMFLSNNLTISKVDSIDLINECIDKLENLKSKINNDTFKEIENFDNSEVL